METSPREPGSKASSEDPSGPSGKAPALAEPGDLELILHALALQPEERLAMLQDFVDTFWTPRHG